MPRKNINYKPIEPAFPHRLFAHKAHGFYGSGLRASAEIEGENGQKIAVYKLDRVMTLRVTKALT